MPETMTSPELIGRLSACLVLGPGIGSAFWPSTFDGPSAGWENPGRSVVGTIGRWVAGVPLDGRKLPAQQRAAYQRAAALLKENATLEVKRPTLEEESVAMGSYYMERATILLRAARLAQGFTQEQAARNLGVGARTYEAWERSETRIPADVIERLNDYALGAGRGNGVNDA